MKQVVKSKSNIEVVEAHNVINVIKQNTDVIVAYETLKHNGLGVLQVNVQGHGFAYHSELVRGVTKLTFTADTLDGTIQKVLNAGRTLLIFDSFAEFAQHAADMAEY